MVKFRLASGNEILTENLTENMECTHVADSNVFSCIVDCSCRVMGDLTDSGDLITEGKSTAEGKEVGKAHS
jgi:hypothetical protein